MNLTDGISEQKMVCIKQRIDINKKQKRKLNDEERLRRAKRICELYSIGEYTLKSCCAVVNVKYSTFQYWAQPNRTANSKRRGYMHDVHALYKKAVEDNKENFRLLLKQAVREGLLLKARGLSYVETQTSYTLNGNNQITIKKTSKIIQPSDNILVFLGKASLSFQ